MTTLFHLPGTPRSRGRTVGLVGSAALAFTAVAAALPSAPAAAASGPALTVAVADARHPISPDIYGMNGASDALEAELHASVDRWGGNSTSRYNWQNNTHNTGSDWYFENIVGSASESVDAFVTANANHGTRSLVTVPLIGYAAKNSAASHPFACSFPRSRFPSQQSFDPWDTNWWQRPRQIGKTATRRRCLRHQRACRSRLRRRPRQPPCQRTQQGLRQRRQDL